MEGSTGFGIDSILSHRAGSPAVPKGDPLVGDGRSPLELSPRSEGSSGCPSPRSPGRECLEAAVPRPGLDAHLQPGQVSAPSQSRTVTSSFLIRDILADCKPLAACAPYSSTNGPHGGQEPAGRIPNKPGEDFREKMEKNTSSSSSDSEYKGKSGSPRGVVQGGPDPQPRAAREAPGAPGSLSDPAPTRPVEGGSRYRSSSKCPRGRHQLGETWGFGARWGSARWNGRGNRCFIKRARGTRWGFRRNDPAVPRGNEKQRRNSACG